MERITDDTLANIVDQLHDEPFIMNGKQRPRQRLLGMEKVTNVRSRIVFAGVTITILKDRRKLLAVL